MREEEIQAAVDATVERFESADEVVTLRRQVAELTHQLTLTRAALGHANRLQSRLIDVAKVAQLDGAVKALHLAVRFGPADYPTWPEYLAARAAELEQQRGALVAEVEGG